MSAVHDSRYIEVLTKAKLTEQQAEAITLVAEAIANGAVQVMKEEDIAKLEERIDKLGEGWAKMEGWAKKDW